MYNPQLETFIKVVDRGSFSKAAEDLFISPSAVIKQINILETKFGFKTSKKNSSRGIFDTSRSIFIQGMPNI